MNLRHIISCKRAASFLFAAVVGNMESIQAATWNNPAGGSWLTAANWFDKTIPNSPGKTAVFGSIITSPQSVTVDGNITVGSIEFDGESYTIAQGTGGVLNLDNSGVAGEIAVTSGGHFISAPIQMTNQGISVSVARALTISG